MYQSSYSSAVYAQTPKMLFLPREDKRSKAKLGNEFFLHSFAYHCKGTVLTGEVIWAIILLLVRHVLESIFRKWKMSKFFSVIWRQYLPKSKEVCPLFFCARQRELFCWDETPLSPLAASFVELCFSYFE